jgi:phosphoribosylaminoimidazole-succinocarboxamide synthase
VLERTDLPFGTPQRGKVRDTYRLDDDRLLLVTTDRLSAFDRVLTCLPHKGQVLNELSAWWFAQLADVVPHHLLGVPDPNAAVARRCRPLPVEVVVRGYITGVTSTSLWRQYAEGGRELYGQRLPDGLRKNEPLPAAMVTPTTKAQHGAHDEPVAPADVVARGLVDAPLWDHVMSVAVELFWRGRARAAEAGLILVDTKYELGLLEGVEAGSGGPSGQLTLIDEVHTPDSSRYWEAATYEARLAAGEEPDSGDKELVRRWYVDAGFDGEGEPPPLPDEVVSAVSGRYVTVYERLTGRTFRPAAEPPGPRIQAAVEAWLAANPSAGTG